MIPRHCIYSLMYTYYRQLLSVVTVSAFSFMVGFVRFFAEKSVYVFFCTNARNFSVRYY